MSRRIDWIAFAAALVASLIAHGVLYGIGLTWQACASAAFGTWIYSRLTETSR